MYFISLIIFLVVVVVSMLLSSQFTAFLDIPSLLLIILLTAPMLMAAGLGGDLIRSFKVMLCKDHPYTKLELQRALHAVEYTMKLLLFSGAIGSLIGLVAVLGNFGDPSHIGPSAAVMLLTVFYALLASSFFLPIRAKLKVMLIE